MALLMGERGEAAEGLVLAHHFYYNSKISLHHYTNVNFLILNILKPHGMSS